MNTQLLRYNVLIEHPTFLPIPPATRDFGRTGRTHRPELSDQSDYSIVLTYNAEVQGLVNYYELAGDVARKLYPIKWVAMQSLVKTLAVKHKRGVPWVYRQYYRQSPQGVMAIKVQVSKNEQETKTAWFGAKPIRHDKRAVVVDDKHPLMTRRNDVVNRLLAQQCELCGATEEVEVHHIHKLKDLERRYRGRRQPPEWVSKMIALRRKTLMTCKRCHQSIHRGTYDGACLSEVYGRAG